VNSRQNTMFRFETAAFGPSRDHALKLKIHTLQFKANLGGLLAVPQTWLNPWSKYSELGVNDVWAGLDMSAQ
jgi:hypothetical protein